MRLEVDDVVNLKLFFTNLFLILTHFLSDSCLTKVLILVLLFSFPFLIVLFLKFLFCHGFNCPIAHIWAPLYCFPAMDILLVCPGAVRLIIFCFLILWFLVAGKDCKMPCAERCNRYILQSAWRALYVVFPWKGMKFCCFHRTIIASNFAYLSYLVLCNQTLYS